MIFSAPEQVLTADADYKAPIALQLYTVRTLLESSFEETMHKVAGIGFLGIETYALPPRVTRERASRTFKDAELKVCAMHTSLPVGAARDSVLRLAETYDCRRVIFAGWSDEEKYASVQAMRKLADLYNETAAFLVTRGLQFGLHNHWREFEVHDGVYPFYYLLDQLDESMFFEIDTYWVKAAGKDPARVVKDFGARAPLLHIKDGPAVKEDLANRQLPAGEGTLDFPAIVRAGGKNIEWLIVEFDEYKKNILDGIKKSYDFLTENGLARGSV